MRSLAEVQADFAAAIRDPHAAPPAGVVDPAGRSDRRRFATYRDNVAVGLSNALASAFPAVKQIVGDEFFAAMARAYVQADPPRSPVLMDYGAGFADFIAGFAPAAIAALPSRCGADRAGLARILPCGRGDPVRPGRARRLRRGAAAASDV